MKSMSMTRYIVFTLVTASVCLFVASVYVEESQQETVLQLQLAIEDQERILQTLATLNGENRADETTEAIIRDCSVENRAQFERMLNQLESLPRTELAQMQQLFDACAGFFAERNALMVARMQREYEVLEQYLTLYERLEPNATSVTDAQQWRELLILETDRSGLLREQVDIQGDIIEALQDEVRDQEAITKLLVRSQQINQQVRDLNRAIDQVRTKLYDV